MTALNPIMTTPAPKATNFPNSTTPLPRRDSTSLYITHPSTDEQYAHSLVNSEEWKGALSVDAYMRREEYLADQDLTRDGGITFWVLLDKFERDESVKHNANRTVLAGCETIRKEALISQNGAIEEVTCHGVCSVFSPVAFRGRGYGERLIRELGKKLETWQSVKGRRQCSALYSDIGKKFYAKNGWHPYAAKHIHLPPIPSKSQSTPTPIPTTNLSLPSTHSIKSTNLESFCATATNRIKHALLDRPDQSTPALALLPNHATIAWHLAREEFVSRELLGKVPDIKGSWTSTISPAIDGEGAGDDKDDKRIFALYARMFYNPVPTETKGNTLHILHLSLPGPAALDAEARQNGIMAVLRLAQEQARDWGCAEVEVWNPVDEVVEACRALLESDGRVDQAGSDSEGEAYGKVVDRETESIPCLRWYGGEGSGSEVGELKIEEATGRVQGLRWTVNEKFGWC